MYITETTENVRKIFEKLEAINDIGKMKFILYIFEKLNNNQINSMNEENPNLIEDSDLVIFNFPSIGFSENACTIFLQYNIMIMNRLDTKNKLLEENGNIIGIEYNDYEKEIISNFEKLSFEEKLDMFAEIIIRYDNETYFSEQIEIINFHSELSGYEIAKLIKDYKLRNKN